MSSTLGYTVGLCVQKQARVWGAGSVIKYFSHMQEDLSSIPSITEKLVPPVLKKCILELAN